MDLKRSTQAVTYNDVLEEVILKPVPDHDGFYFFPDDHRLAVSKSGEVLNVKTGNKIKPYFNKSNRAYIHISSPVIKVKNYKLHRILARTFIGRPIRLKHLKFKKLEVNHIDGNPRNNQLNNLEWVTGKENILHSNRILGNRANTKAILAKSLINGNIIRFNTTKECAEYFNIKRGTLWKHLNSGNSGKCKKDNCIFKLDDESEWKEYHPMLIGHLGEDNKEIKCLILDSTGNIVYLSNKAEAYKILNMSRRHFDKKFKNKDQGYYNDYFVFFC